MKALLVLASLSAFAGLASASVSYNVAGAFTVFNGGAASGQTESATNGTDSFSLSYAISNSGDNTVSSFPTFISYGNFTLACTAVCDGGPVSFPAFTFVLTVNDSTDTGIGTYTGTSSGGPVSYNGSTGSSTIAIDWSPLQLGPNTSNAGSGTFANTVFTINAQTQIVDPTTNGGVTSIQGEINSLSTPEPATFGLLGAALLGLGVVARKRKA